MALARTVFEGAYPDADRHKPKRRSRVLNFHVSNITQDPLSKECSFHSTQIAGYHGKFLTTNPGSKFPTALRIAS